MNPFFNLLIIWLLLAPLNYIITRDSLRRVGVDWTKASRLFCIVISFFGGPVWMLAVSVTDLIDRISDSDWGKKEVKW